MNKKARLIAFYLPQYHPIPENDQWWGKGFTEWMNVGKARPLFKGHYQPKVPADLGYYDLRLPESRKAQAELAREYGIEGFCYWHYWFGNGKQLLERPFNEVLESGEPDFPFCLAWANETWKGFDHGLKNRNVLIEQLYPGVDDYTAHFYKVLPAFKDKRYLTVDDKPIFLIFKPLATNQIGIFIETWRRLALENGLKGIHFIGQKNQLQNNLDQYWELGVDAINTIRLNNYIINHRTFFHKIYDKLRKTLIDAPLVYQYELVSKFFLNTDEDILENIYPSIIPNWDHTPRSGREGFVMNNSTPDLFEKHLKKALELVNKKRPENRIIFVKSWNEWAEGNYMEPDLKWGKKYLETLKKQVMNNKYQ